MSPVDHRKQWIFSIRQGKAGEMGERGSASGEFQVKLLIGEDEESLFFLQSLRGS